METRESLVAIRREDLQRIRMDGRMVEGPREVAGLVEVPPEGVYGWGRQKWRMLRVMAEGLEYKYWKT